MAPVCVSFRKVSKNYDRQSWVVDNLNLDVYEGEFLTMLGPSGSGKTTCLMMLAGFEEVTSGEILIRGERVNDIPPHKRGLGLVFQNYALFPHMTVAGNLAFPLQVRGMDKAEIRARVDEALEMVHLSGLGGRFPAQLSGGQQQRVALARALIFHPTLVLMDEPLGALDKQLRERMQYEIKRLHEQLGLTMIYVTHDQGEALTLSSRVAVFNEGRIQQIDAPDSIYEHPSNAFTAGFIGENNLLQGALLELDGDTCAVEADSGGRLRGTPVGVAAGDGGAVLLAVRPERVLINPDGDCANALDGRISDLVYLGDYMRAVIELGGGGGELVAKYPNDRGKRDIETGQSVKVGWHPEDCRVFPAPPPPRAEAGKGE
ncbi:MAG: ABC transporter ATP-binding protein [Gammaproteobacteria bacterium]|nr:ABC transporter ATP-binding protein [Gammaproteobacteria bacterium]